MVTQQVQANTGYLTARVTSNITAQNAFVVPYGMIGIIESITVDNQSAALRTINILDSFTPTVSNQVASPAAQNPTLWTGSAVQAANPLRSGPSELGGGIRILGTCQVTGDAIAATCVITIKYRLI